MYYPPVAEPSPVQLPSSLQASSPAFTYLLVLSKDPSIYCGVEHLGPVALLPHNKR